MKKQTHSQYHRVYYDSNANQSLSFSKVTPNSTSQYQVKLPPLYQPIISKYRNQKLKLNLFKSSLFDSNFFEDLLCGRSKQYSISMCQKCQKSEHLNLCTFIIGLIQQKYDWRTDKKIKSTYDSYTKKKINIFLSDEEIMFRIQSKFNILGVVLLQNHKLLLTRIIKNYIKHTIYYGDYQKMTLQNDLYFWFLTGIYYHIGIPKYFNQLQSLPKDAVGIQQYLMFWMLQIIMKKLKDCSEQKLISIGQQTYQYCQQFYKKQCQVLEKYKINLLDIFVEWTKQLMMGYLGIQFIGFLIKSLLKQGYNYAQKVMLSYFQRMVMKLQNQQVISFRSEQSVQLKNSNFGSVNGSNSLNSNHHAPQIKIQTEQQIKSKKQQILKILLDSNQEWAGIFFNTSIFDFN